jgi:fibronectin type 3 domain-containing protein
MGYNFTANNAYFKPTAAGSAEVGVQITNTGVAPFYYPWTMSLGLENSSGQVVQTWNTPWDIRTVMPASVQPYPDWKVSGSPSSIPYGYPQYFQTDVNLSGVPAGSYQWVLKVDNPLSASSAAAKPLLFANATQNTNGWLGLGGVTVNSAGAGTAPTAPTGLRATGAASSISLNWTAPSSGTPAGYEILRDGTVIATTQSTSYTDLSLPTSASHSYTVEAFDSVGDTSPASAAVAASTTSGVDNTAPTAPANVTTSNVTGDETTLSWTQSNDDTGVAGYDIYRNGTLVGTTTFTDYTDIELAGSTAYQYTVKAYDPAGNLSAPSSPVNVTTGASETTTAPGTPTALASPSQAGSAIDLSWTAPTSTGGLGAIAGYDIYRNGILVGTTTATEQGTGGSPTPTIYTDTGLTAGTSYTYTVAAFDAAGDTSTASAPITAATVALSAGGSSGTVYEADASANVLAGGAVVSSCSACLDGNKVGYIGEGGTLTLPDVTETAAGSHTLTVYYVDGDAGRSAVINVNGAASTVSFTGTNNGNWDTVQSKTVTVALNAGTNTIEFSDPSAYAPDIDHIVV